MPKKRPRRFGEAFSFTSRRPAPPVLRALEVCWRPLAPRGTTLQHLFLVPFGDVAQLLHEPNIELADALLSDAELVADLFEGHVLVAVEAGPHADDLALARVEVFQQPVNLVGRLFGAGEALTLVTAVVRGDVEELLVARLVTLAAEFLVRNAAGEVLHDRPARIGAELVAASVIELLDGA